MALRTQMDWHQVGFGKLKSPTIGPMMPLPFTGVGSIAINEELFDVDEGLEGLSSDEDEPAHSATVS